MLASAESGTGIRGGWDGAAAEDYGVLAGVGSRTGTYAYTGREWDPETPLYYYRARYYEPGLSRFLNEDPAPQASGGIWANLFAYVNNDPLRYSDPSGKVRFENFPSRDREKQALDAIERIRQKLSEDCPCAGNKSAKLLQKLKDPALTINYVVGSPRCGYTPFKGVVGINRKIDIDQDAFDGLCCYQGPAENSLPGTIMHEVTHLQFGREKTAYRLEEKCWGCKEPN